MKLIIKIENIVENAMKNQTATHEINNIEKKSYILISEFLRSNKILNNLDYYNLKFEKTKSNVDRLKSITITDASASTIPRYRLSLFGILFKNHYFVEDAKIYHPFEATIYLNNYRYQTKIEEVVKIKNKFLGRFLDYLL